MSNGNGFSEEHLTNLLEKWQDDYRLKKHDGEIRGIEMTKKYIVSNNATDANKFVINVTRLYKFITCEKDGDTITLSVSVKPDTMNEFLNFCTNLKIEEAKLISSG
ncbi:hypothetical protein [Paenibacillus sp. Leaf72]|uniref:hypothetical protein n=1 Tax=Paenibacillus sp. Leaf72 TaxID=1736234 RepID=UPI000701697F|nr:hypothetical protein [Paenibacillus sp. Leaf72]KQN97016.1 hypothetical protein ASF12_23390 [Paenibacillus sp. Leaf72]